ncbi:response regulator [Hymenobacter sp. UYCo722]|uniref:response regulator n=1 Tax=Hymenobacter sp. UYCo722 TaxID=3156335 RepID=UPI003391BD34
MKNQGKKHRPLLAARPDSQFTLNRQGFILTANEAALLLTGVERDDLLGADFFPFFTAPEEVWAAYQQLLAQGTVRQLPFTLRTRTGTLTTEVLLDGAVHQHAQGGVLGATLTVREVAGPAWVSELRRAQEELAIQHQERKQRINELRRANVALTFQRTEKKKRTAELRLANKELAYQNQEKEKRAAELFIANLELGFQNEEKEKRAQELLVANRELAFQNREKEKRAQELHLANIELLFQNAEKEKRAAELVLANVELAFQNEEKVKRAAELLVIKYARSLIEATRDPLVTVSPDGKITDLNQAAVAITGLRREAVVGSDFCAYFTDPHGARAVYQTAFTQGTVAHSSLTLRHPDGQLTDVRFNGAVYRGDDDEVVGVVLVAHDVSEQQAAHTTHVKKQFLAHMSHEIRTPLNAILGMSRLLATPPLRGPQADYLHAITASAENLLVMVDDILDCSKIDAGRLDLEIGGFGTRQLCAQVVQTLQDKAEAKGLELIIHVEAGVPAVLRSDPHRLTQILLHLAGNAVKFTERGRVWVSCTLVRPAADGVAEVAFTVRDTGIGIDPAYLAQAFDDFSQQDASVTRRFGGTGLGLGISRLLVGLLGGELQMESAPGQGTTAGFTLRLPVGAAQDLPGPLRPGAGPWREALRGRRVLLVEDNAFNRLLARVTLEQAGLDVSEAEDGAEAVAAVRAAAPSFDAVLMDVHMPVLNGYEATAVLRAEFGPGLPIIALTANATSGERAKCLAAGMSDYLSKPFQEDDLLRLIYDWVLGPGVPANVTQ